MLLKYMYQWTGRTDSEKSCRLPSHRKTLPFDATPILTPWFEIVGENQLRGGWWMHGAVPKHLVSKLPHVPNMVPSEWNKVSASVDAKAQTYFVKP